MATLFLFLSPWGGYCAISSAFNNLFRPNPGRREKINLNFYFRTSLGCLKMLYKGLKSLKKHFEEPQRTVKIKNLQAFFYKQRIFSAQPQCCLTFSWIEVHMLLKCCLLRIEQSYRGILYFVYLCPCLRLGLLIIWSIFHYLFHFHCN